ncbi:MAG: MobF family relaxase, partial [Acidimicrobiia bacterium]
MLRITKLADAEYLLRQVAAGVEDYYVGSGEAPGVWQGRLAAELALAGVVEADQLRALLLGRDPVTDAELLGARRPRTVTAFDVTFSAPKSVSLLWAFASPEVASVASIAHVEAVAVALDLLERRAGATRQVVDGERQRIPTGVAAATFVHRSSRDGDPQLHTHSVVVNLGRRSPTKGVHRHHEAQGGDAVEGDSHRASRPDRIRALDLQVRLKLYARRMGSYQIAEVARRSGFTASTLRYYDNVGLVSPAGRTDAGYRRYDDDSLARLAFISRAKQLGCTLPEITGLVTAWDGRRCEPVQAQL